MSSSKEVCSLQMTHWHERGKTGCTNQLPGKRKDWTRKNWDAWKRRIRKIKSRKRERKPRKPRKPRTPKTTRTQQIQQIPIHLKRKSTRRDQSYIRIGWLPTIDSSHWCFTVQKCQRRRKASTIKSSSRTKRLNYSKKDITLRRKFASYLMILMLFLTLLTGAYRKMMTNPEKWGASKLVKMVNTRESGWTTKTRKLLLKLLKMVRRRKENRHK